MANTPESLVKYETPILVSSSFKSKGQAGKKLPQVQQPQANQRTEDYLNSILPPQEIVDQGQLWVRYVSPTPATTADVTNLAKDLDKRIFTMQARDSGICQIREELFSQCFDELIRQITINCAERGYLLVRVRDEIRMSKNALQGLYDSSISYGMKKALVAEQSKKDMQSKISKLEKETRDLENQCAQMEDSCIAIERDGNAEHDKQQEAHEEARTGYKNKIITLKFELDKVLETKIM